MVTITVKLIESQQGFLGRFALDLDADLLIGAYLCWQETGRHFRTRQTVFFNEVGDGQVDLVVEMVETEPEWLTAIPGRIPPPERRTEPAVVITAIPAY